MSTTISGREHLWTDVRPEGHRLGIADWLFFWCMTVVVVIGPVLKLGGTLGFGATVAVAALYGIVLNRRLLIDYFALFTGVGVVYVFLSYFEVLPAAWTIYYDPGAIPIQAAFVLGLMPLVAGFRRFFGQALDSGSMVLCCCILVVLNLTVSPWLETLVAPENILALGFSAMVLSNLVNSELALLLGLAYLVQVARWRLLMGLALVAVPYLILVVDRSMQVNIALALLVLLMARRFSTLVFRSVIVVFTAACVAGMVFVDLSALAVQDPNTVIRSLMWQDGIEAFAQSHGLGIGFGREAVKNIYPLLDKTAFYEDADIMTGGIHNSFISVFMRMGVLGGVLFCLGFLYSAWPSSRPIPERETAYFAYGMAYISCWVNVAIESPLALVGIAMMLGYAQACRDKAEGVIPAAERAHG